jgi:hypothetical protein
MGLGSPTRLRLIPLRSGEKDGGASGLRKPQGWDYSGENMKEREKLAVVVVGEY